MDEMTLDPDLLESLENVKSEDPLITEYGTPGKGQDNEGIHFAKGWFPDSDQWQGKTNITEPQAKKLAAVRNLSKAFPQVAHMEDFLTSMVTDYEMYKTSVEGESRKEQMRVLKSIFGGTSEAEETTQSLVSTILSDKVNENED